MRKLALILAALAFATPALAYRAVWNPPARYDHPYAGHMVLEQVPQTKVVTMCRALFTKHGDMAQVAAFTNEGKGCSWVQSGSCTVITINAPYHDSLPSDVFRHERGHCNGWPADHPD